MKPANVDLHCPPLLPYEAAVVRMFADALDASRPDEGKPAYLAFRVRAASAVIAMIIERWDLTGYPAIVDDPAERR